MLHVGIITLFPEMFHALQSGICGRALAQQLLSLEYFYLRDFTEDTRKTVDDRPYGGGPGMVMMAEPLLRAIKAAKKKLGDNTLTVYLSPQGKRVTQNHLHHYIHSSPLPRPLLLICGRYEGIDERIITLEVDEEWSIGDLVLSGGELPAMLFIDALTRLLPGALGDDTSADQDSFSEGLLEHPQYTRPQEVEKLEVPEVLLAGNHKAIHQWRLKQSLGRTWLKRPDLLNEVVLSPEQIQLLGEFKHEYFEES